MALWSRLFSGIFGVGVGIAAADAVEPVVEVAKQEAWAGNANRVLALESLAALLAQGLGEPAEIEDQARRQGFDADKVAHLAALAQRAPGEADARRIHRRRKVDAPTLHHAWAKAQIEPEWWPALDELLAERLSPEALAYAVVRGLIDDQGILPVAPPHAPGKVEQFPTFPIDWREELKDSGLDAAQFGALVGSSGRPMAPEAAAHAVFRGIIERSDYERAVGEGDVRNEWADAIFEAQRPIISAADVAGLWLRGWVDEEGAKQLAVQTGAEFETVRWLYLNRGRPAAPGQMATAAFRGIDGPDGRPMDEAQFLKGIRESDIRPEWGPLLWQSRYHVLPVFQVNRLVQAGAIDAATGARWMHLAGLMPEMVAALESYWSQPAAAGASSWVKRAQGRLFTATQRAYIVGDIDAGAAGAELTALGLQASEVEQVLALWARDRALPRRDLTQAQVKRFYKLNEWSRDQAFAWLVDQGMIDTDAETLIASW